MLSGSAITLVPFNHGHAEKTRAWMNDLHLMELLDRMRPVSEMEHDTWVADLLKRQDMLFLAMIDNSSNTHVGNVWLCDIHERHRKAEVRIVIGEPAATGRGLGAEALQLLADFAFQRMNLHRLYAYVLSSNARARHAFEKSGFLTEGILRSDRWVGTHYADMVLLARLRVEAAHA